MRKAGVAGRQEARLTMPGVNFHSGCSQSSACCKASSLHFSTMVSSFTFSHQLDFSLIRLERAHIRSSTIWRRKLRDKGWGGENHHSQSLDVPFPVVALVSHDRHQTGPQRGRRNRLLEVESVLAVQSVAIFLQLALFSPWRPVKVGCQPMPVDARVFLSPRVSIRRIT